MTLTGEQRYRQAILKDTLVMRRNMRRFMANEIAVLEGSRRRQLIIAEIERAYEAGKRDARQP